MRAARGPAHDARKPFDISRPEESEPQSGEDDRRRRSERGRHGEMPQGGQEHERRERRGRDRERREDHLLPDGSPVQTPGAPRVCGAGSTITLPPRWTSKIASAAPDLAVRLQHKQPVDAREPLRAG